MAPGMKPAARLAHRSDKHHGQLGVERVRQGCHAILHGELAQLRPECRVVHRGFRDTAERDQFFRRQLTGLHGRADCALAVARQTTELDFLQPFLSASTRNALADESPGLRAGLAVASPDFMYK